MNELIKLQEEMLNKESESEYTSLSKSAQSESKKSAKNASVISDSRQSPNQSQSVDQAAPDFEQNPFQAEDFQTPSRSKVVFE